MVCKMTNKLLNVIFDFDGTLADSFFASVQKFLPLAEKFNLRKLNQHEIEQLRELPSKEIIKYLKIPFYKIPSVLRHARECLRNEIPSLSTFMNMPEVLEELHQDCSLGIVTSNSSENVALWLEHHKIAHLFDFIYAESGYFGKKNILKKLIKSHRMEPLQTFYVGDETRDIDAARKCNINSIAVSWGFNSEATLIRSRPDYITRTPEDILTIIKPHALAFASLS
ncbi:HAD-superfamily hydrolase [Legionella beliardensis]|uniref:HAD-superfamily hydrolase n=2 Tax=Legionella beliardensis TaxID=91822 RepID=A0A378JR14_9GAMM|nr:HAD-superfamily hydrolase [Legionella beliardensis]